MTLSPDGSSARPTSSPTEAHGRSARKRLRRAPADAGQARTFSWSAYAATGALLLVSACASHSPVKLTATQEAARYEARAAGDYTPPGPPDDPWGPYITEASNRFDVPDRWIREVMRVESGGELYHGGSLVTSPVGAMGLMQIMPATYDELKAELNLSDDPYDPHNSILAGTAYIREMYDLYGSPGFLAAYNAGPGTLDAYLTGNRRLPGETRRYVAMIAPYIQDSVPRNRSQADMLAMNAMQARNGTASSDDGQTEIASAAVPPPASTPASTPVLAAAPSVAAAQSVAVARQPALAPLPAQPAPALLAAPPPTVLAAAARPPASGEADAPDAADLADATPPVRATRPRHVPPQDAPRPVEVAMLPEPPPEPSRPQASSQMAAFIPEPPAPPSSPSGRKPGFRLVTPAFAEAMPHRGGGAEWSIQLGAYDNQSQAHAVAGTARGQEPRLLASAKPDIASVRDGRSTIYRARLTGLSREGAIAACEKLARTRTACMVVSPAT